MVLSVLTDAIVDKKSIRITRMNMQKVTQQINRPFSSLRLVLELIMVIIFKATCVLLLWTCFFSHPVKQGLTQETYQDHFFSKAHQKQPR
tara:strand:+ start:1948 stop:2217 length:270 start_codon:yes stop_codon:yes gene_type:complete